MPRKRKIFLFLKKLKKIKNFSFKRLTCFDKFGMIDRLCENAVYGLIREVTEISRKKPLDR